MPNPRFDEWIVFKHPGSQTLHIWGALYGRQGFPEGELAASSPVTKFNKSAQIVMTRSGSIYQLGTPAAGSEKDAEMLKDLPELEI